MSTSSPQPASTLYGLVLAGGRSKRMQRDKAALPYDGRAQLERAMELLEPHVVRAFASVREDQVGDPLRRRFAQIVDTPEGKGPIAGIVAAQARYPEVAWLVLACDLPYLDTATLEHLVRSRRPDRQATAYRSSHDGLPEPLCAIYEPSSRAAISAYVGSGRDCPRKFLLQAQVALLDPLNPRALDNINTPKEYGSALDTFIHSGQTPDRAADHVAAGLSPLAGRSAEAGSMRITVQYYALLREQAGRSTETLTTGARTPRELYEELRKRHPFSLAPEMLRVAVNEEFGDWSQRLAEGDAIVFIPPVAGG
jgi:molybdenum cofactor guanylyltransferase